MRITKISQLPWQPRGLVLDPYAGNRRWWKGSNVIVVFTDKYPVADDIIEADVTALPFDDATFDEVWADPPHLIRKSPFKPTSRFYRCSMLTPEQPRGYFGTYPTRDTVHAEWSSAARELSRVTKTDGLLVWKSIDGAKTASQCVNETDLVCLTDYWRLIDELRFPSVMSWSSATTVYTKWQRISK